MAKAFKFLTLAVALAFMARWASTFVADRRPRAANHLASTDFSAPDQDPPLAWVGSYDRNDSTTYQVIFFERNPTTGERIFLVDDSPVPARLKAYLDAALVEQKIAIFINHPDGESKKWLELPMPLYLSLTEAAPPQ